MAEEMVDTNQAETVVEKETLMTQEQTDQAIASRLKREREKFAKQLGIESYSDENVENFMQSITSQKELITTKDAEISDIKASSTEKDFLIEAMKSGVTSDNIERAVKLAKLEVNEETSIEKAFENILTDFPMLKGVTQESKIKIGEEVKQTDKVTEIDSYMKKYENSKYYNK